MEKLRIKPRAYLDVCAKGAKKKFKEKKKQSMKSSKGMQIRPIQNIVKKKKIKNV